MHFQVKTPEKHTKEVRINISALFLIIEFTFLNFRCHLSILRLKILFKRFALLASLLLASFMLTIAFWLDLNPISFLVLLYLLLQGQINLVLRKWSNRNKIRKLIEIWRYFIWNDVCFLHFDQLRLESKIEVHDFIWWKLDVIIIN